MKTSTATVFVALVFTLSASPSLADDTGFAASHDWAKSGGRTCFADHAHSGSGDGMTKPAARSAAIREWASFTSMEYGSNWASYSASAGQVTSYVKAEKGWTAVVEGRPCRR